MEEKLKGNTIQEDETWEQSFEECKEKFFAPLAEQLEDLYSPYPTKIQQDFLFEYLDDRKKPVFFVQAPGGSGKTLTFTIPAVIEALRQLEKKQNFKMGDLVEFTEKKVKGKDKQCYKYYPQIVIIADTKPLIEQITEEIEKCIPEKFKGQVRVSKLYSGNSLESFGQILVSAPTILSTLMASQQDRIELSNCVLFASDEAEQVYKTSAEPLKVIIEKVKENESIKSIFASATLTKEFKEFVSGILKPKDDDKTQLQIDLSLDGVSQYSFILPSCDLNNEYDVALEQIQKLLKDMYEIKKIDSQVMIFIETVKSIDNIYNSLKDIGIQCGFIHSKMSQDRKEQNQLMQKVYKDFKKGSFKVLICTDLMARGIDIDKVGLVINLFAPRINPSQSNTEINAPQYMHRIARTGRHVKKGVALTYYRPNQSRFINMDSSLNQRVSEIEGIKDNKIETFDIGTNFTEIIAEATLDAVSYNQDPANQIAKQVEKIKI